MLRKVVTLSALLAASANGKKENVPSCDVFAMIDYGKEFFQYAECQRIALKVMSHTPPSVTEMCECARNEIDKLDDYKAELQCTLWPTSNVWRSTTLYDKIKEDCAAFPKPKKPWIADTAMYFFGIPRDNKDQAMEVGENAATTLGSSVLTVDESSLVGLRFPNILVEPNDEVQAAYLGLQPSAEAGNMNNTRVTISLEKNANSKPFSTDVNNVYGRSLSKTGLTQLIVYQAMAPYSNAMFVDVQSMVTEVVSMGPWKKRNPITFIFDYFTGNPLKFYSSDSKTGQGPLLLIQYKPSEGGAGRDVDPTPAPGQKGNAKQQNSNGDDSDSGSGGSDGGMSGGAVAAIVICVFFVIGFIAYVGYNYMQNKSLLMGFGGGSSGFKRFGSQDQGTMGDDLYEPPTSSQI